MTEKKDTGHSTPVFEMGLSDGQTASLVGFEDETLSDMLEAVGVKIVDAKLSGPRDHYFVYMDAVESTITFGMLKQKQSGSGAIWAILKKDNPELSQKEVIEAAKQKSLVPVFDNTYQQDYWIIKFVVEQ